MIPLLLIGAGAYLIYNSQKPQKMAKGGAIKWQDVEVGDSALVKSENKMGVIVKTYGRKFHLKFVDGTDKTYDAEDLKFIKDEEFAKGGAVKRFVEMRNGKPVYALKDAIYHVSYGRLNDKGYPQTTGTSKVYRVNTGLKKINDYKKDKDYSVFEEKEDEAGIYTITFVDKTGFVISFDRDDLYEKGGPILENPKFTFKTDNDYHNARSFGYIDDYEIVRIEVKYPTGYQVDFATHSEEEYYEALERLKKSGAEIIRTYQDEMYYDINEYYDEDEDKGGDDDDYNEGGDIERRYVMFVDTLQEAELLGKGGKVKFRDKVKSISENLKGRKVPKRLQKEYGKTYDKKWERDESARRIAGSQLKKMKE